MFSQFWHFEVKADNKFAMIFYLASLAKSSRISSGSKLLHIDFIYDSASEFCICLSFLSP